MSKQKTVSVIHWEHRGHCDNQSLGLIGEPLKEEQRGSSAVFLVCKEERVCLCGKPLALKLCVTCNVCNMQYVWIKNWTAQWRLSAIALSNSLASLTHWQEMQPFLLGQRLALPHLLKLINLEGGLFTGRFLELSLGETAPETLWIRVGNCRN